MCHVVIQAALVQYFNTKSGSISIFLKTYAHVYMFQHKKAVDSIARHLGHATGVNEMFQAIWFRSLRSSPAEEGHIFQQRKGLSVYLPYFYAHITDNFWLGFFLP